jgi:hypothetical protein
MATNNIQVLVQFFGDKIVLCVNNTENVQYKFYVYLTVTNQNKFFPTSSIAG